MHSPRPRTVGIVMLVFGLALALLLAIAQSEPRMMLNEFAILAVGLLALLSVAAGLFMIIRNRGVRTGPGVR